MGADAPDAPATPPRRQAAQRPPRREPPLLPSPWAVAAAVVPPSPGGARVVPVTGRGAVAAYVTAAVPWLVVRFLGGELHCGSQGRCLPAVGRGTELTGEQRTHW